MKKKVIFIILIILTLTLTLVAFIHLPEQIIIQVGFDGKPTNIVPKPIGLLIPVLLSGYGLFKSREDKKGYIISIIAIVMLFLTLIFNK